MFVIYKRTAVIFLIAVLFILRTDIGYVCFSNNERDIDSFLMQHLRNKEDIMPIPYSTPQVFAVQEKPSVHSLIFAQQNPLTLNLMQRLFADKLPK